MASKNSSQPLSVTASIFFLPHRVGLVQRCKMSRRISGFAGPSMCSITGFHLGARAFSSKAAHRCAKAHGLIRRFSEDIDITVFREDLKQAATIEDMEKPSGKKRRAKLDAIRDACRAWVAGPLRESLAHTLTHSSLKMVASSLIRRIRTGKHYWFGFG